MVWKWLRIPWSRLPVWFPCSSLPHWTAASVTKAHKQRTVVCCYSATKWDIIFQRETANMTVPTYTINKPPIQYLLWTWEKIGVCQVKQDNRSTAPADYVECGVQWTLTQFSLGLDPVERNLKRKLASKQNLNMAIMYHIAFLNHVVIILLSCITNVDRQLLNVNTKLTASWPFRSITQKRVYAVDKCTSTQSTWTEY